MQKIGRKARNAVVLAYVLILSAPPCGFGQQNASPSVPILSEVVQSTATSTLASGPAATIASPVASIATGTDQAKSSAASISSSSTNTTEQKTESVVRVQSLPTATAAPLPFEDRITTATTATLPVQKPEYSPLPGQMEQGANERAGGGMIPEHATLTLSQCIDIALGKNPTVVAATGTVDITKSRVWQARAVYFPQVSAFGTAGRSKNAPAVVGTGFNSPNQLNHYSSGVTANMTLFDFGRMWSSVNIAKYNLESSRSDLNTTEDTIAQNVKRAYFAVLQAKRNKDVAADVITQFELHLDQAKGFYEVGTAAKIDVIKAQVDLSNAKLNLINTENALKIAWVNLNNTMGVPNAPSYAIEDNLFFTPYIITLEEATRRAFENRPDLKSIIARRQAAEENITLQRSGFLPTLTANGTYAKAGDSTPPTQSTDSWNAGLTLNIPLFNGFLTTHQVAEAKANLYVVRANEESVRQQVLLEIRQAYLNLEAAEASIPTAELALAQAKENLDIANGRYGAGVGSPIEVSDAFATYVTAQASFNNALYNYKIAQATIEKAMGAR